MATRAQHAASCRESHQGFMRHWQAGNISSYDLYNLFFGACGVNGLVKSNQARLLNVRYQSY